MATTPTSPRPHRIANHRAMHVTGAKSRFPSNRMIGFETDQTINQLYIPWHPEPLVHPSTDILFLCNIIPQHWAHTSHPGAAKNMARYPQIMGLCSTRPSPSSAMSLAVTQGVSTCNIYAPPPPPFAMKHHSNNHLSSTIHSISFRVLFKPGQPRHEATLRQQNKSVIAHVLFAGQQQRQSKNQR